MAIQLEMPGYPTRTMYPIAGERYLFPFGLRSRASLASLCKFASVESRLLSTRFDSHSSVCLLS